MPSTTAEAPAIPQNVVILYSPDKLAPLGAFPVNGPIRYQKITQAGKAATAPVTAEDMPFLLPGANHDITCDQLTKLESSAQFQEHLDIGVYEIIEPEPSDEGGTGASRDFSQVNVGKIIRATGNQDWLVSSKTTETRPQVRQLIDKRLESLDKEMAAAQRRI